MPGNYAVTYYEFGQMNIPVTKNFRGTINFQDRTWTGQATAIS